MKKIHVLIMLFIALGFNDVHAWSTESACSKINLEFNKLNKTFPMALDYTTTIVGASAVYIEGICNIRYANIVDLSAMLRGWTSSAQDNYGYSERDILSYLKTPQGHSDLKEILKNTMVARTVAANKASPVAIYELKNVRVSATFHFDPPEVSEIYFVFFDSASGSGFQ